MLNTVPLHFIIVNCKKQSVQKTVQNSISKKKTFTDLTILNACPGKSTPYYAPNTSSPKVI